MLITAEHVAKKLGCSARHVVERWRHRPGSPKPVPELKRPLKWRLSDIEQYCGD